MASYAWHCKRHLGWRMQSRLGQYQLSFSIALRVKKNSESDYYESCHISADQNFIKCPVSSYSPFHAFVVAKNFLPTFAAFPKKVSWFGHSQISCAFFPSSNISYQSLNFLKISLETKYSKDYAWSRKPGLEPWSIQAP